MAIKKNKSLKGLNIPGLIKGKMRNKKCVFIDLYIVSEQTMLNFYESVAFNDTITEVTINESDMPLPLRGKSMKEIKQYFR